MPRLAPDFGTADTYPPAGGRSTNAPLNTSVNTLANSGGAGAAVAPAMWPSSRQGFEAIPGGVKNPLPGRQPPGATPEPGASRPQHPAFPPQGGAYQPPLFREGGASKVVAIPTMAPLRPHDREPQTRRTPRNSSPRPTRGGGAVPQQEFQFGGEPELAASSEVIFCDAPVALPAHRMMAAAMDASMVLIGAGMFLGVFLFSGGEMVLNRQTIPFLVGVVAVLALFYRILWCIADGDTPGMRFAGLKLVDFDGRRPNREMRGLRQAAGLLSVLSVGLGLVWALVDEENLTWHDHISKTFPTAG